MISIHLEAGRVEVRKQPRPERPDGFALIRLLAGGICNTDLELQRGYYGFSGTPGHEFVGEVVAADTDRISGPSRGGRNQPGLHSLRLVPTEAWEDIVHIARCWALFGTPARFSDFFTLPESNLHLVPDSISTETAVFTEPLAAACQILDQVRIPQAARWPC